MKKNITNKTKNTILFALLATVAATQPMQAGFSIWKNWNWKKTGSYLLKKFDITTAKQTNKQTNTSLPHATS